MIDMYTVSDKIRQEVKSVDELIELSCKSPDGGYNYADRGTPEEFKKRYEYFKNHITEVFPELSIKEILNVYRYFWVMKNEIISETSGYEHHFCILEFEEYLNNKSLPLTY